MLPELPRIKPGFRVLAGVPWRGDDCGVLPDGRAVMRFQSRTAVITGGAIGFGRAFARALVAEGANMVIADIDVEMAERTAAELVSVGGQAIAVSCDVADPDRV